MLTKRWAECCQRLERDLFLAHRHAGSLSCARPGASGHQGYRALVRPGQGAPGDFPRRGIGPYVEQAKQVDRTEQFAADFYAPGILSSATTCCPWRNAWRPSMKIRTKCMN